MIDHCSTPTQTPDTEFLACGEYGCIHRIFALDISVKLKTDFTRHPLTKCLDGTTGNGDLSEVHELNI
ncbi:hypothetical protein D3C85_1814450 [compost metagenome]